MNETAVSQHIILDAAQHSVDLWRNNSGGFDDEGGRFVRYGLGAFTKEQQLASSDYIGITPIFITPDMVGTFVGVFTAVEMKKTGWKFSTNDKTSLYQSNFIDMVLKRGGYAGFAQNIEEFRSIIKHG